MQDNVQSCILTLNSLIRLDISDKPPSISPTTTLTLAENSVTGGNWSGVMDVIDRASVCKRGANEWGLPHQSPGVVVVEDGEGEGGGEEGGKGEGELHTDAGREEVRSEGACCGGRGREGGK